MASSANSAVRALSLELKSLQEQPVEGFRVNLINDDNLFEWEVAIFGPPSTMYEGGYFKAHLKFPSDYPYSPPSMRFMTKVWHPNVYENGDLCISILHPPHDDPQSGELACERWNPTQNVRTILLSVISLLNEPNTFSPANVDASVMYRKWKESRGRDDEYAKIVKKQVDLSKADADKDGVIVPLTVEDYCVRGTAKPDDMDPLFDCDYEEYYDMDDSSSETDEEEDGHENDLVDGPRKEEDVQSVDMGMGEEVIEDGGSNGGLFGIPIGGGDGVMVVEGGIAQQPAGAANMMAGQMVVVDFSCDSGGTGRSGAGACTGTHPSPTCRPGVSGLSSTTSTTSPFVMHSPLPGDAQKNLSYHHNNQYQTTCQPHHHHHNHSYAPHGRRARHGHGGAGAPITSSSTYGHPATAGPRVGMDDNEDSGQGEN